MDFPNSPTVGQTFSSGGLTWRWSGVKWDAATGAGAATGINQLTGDVLAGPGSGSQVATLGTTAVSPGSYTNTNLTVDAKGRITAAANGTSGGALPSGVAYDQFVYISGAWGAQRPRYVLSCFVPGTLAASQVLLVHNFSKGVTIPANFALYLGHSTRARCVVAPTASATFSLQKAVPAAPTTFTEVATIQIGAGSYVLGGGGTTGGAAQNFAQGDTLQIVGPTTPDVTLAGVAITLVGFES